MIDEVKLIERLKLMRDKCCDRANKKKNINFARKSLDISQIIGIINNQPKIGEWIPCSERLPEKDGVYICTQENYGVQEKRLISKSVEYVEFYNGKWKRAKFLKIVAWQPLPEPYKEA